MTVGALLATDGVVEEVVLGGRLGFMAFHGGLEGGTEVAARAAASSSGASLYTIVQPPTLRWHLPSHQIGASPSTGLTLFLGHVRSVVAVHGYGRPDRPLDLLLGGSNRGLAARLGGLLREHLPEWNVIDALEEIPIEMRGLHPSNPVNQALEGGVQLELPPRVRGATARWSDTAVCVPEPGLITALAQLADQSMS